MTAQELDAQRKMARANLELTKLKHARKKVSDAELAEAERIWRELANYDARQLPKLERPKPEYPKGGVVTFSDEVASQLDALRRRQAEIDYAKNVKITELSNVPKQVNARELVQEIKALRAQWIEIGDRIRYVQQHGAMPEAPPVVDQDALTRNLPQDRYELKRLIDNLRSNLSKYRSRLTGAKTELKRSHYKQLIAESEAKLEIMNNNLAAL